MSTFYKVLGDDGSACHGGHGQWFLPVGKRPGKWMPKIENPVPCERGYHVCEGASDLIEWLGPTIYVAEIRGEQQRDTNKTVAGEARLVRRCTHWNEKTARLFAAACARDVLPIYEKQHPNDDRVRKCIEAVEAFARGEIDRVVLDAARDAARDAAWDAARAAASDAARAAARAAARDAAWAAAWAAARDAAWAAARKRQSARLAHLLRTGEVLNAAERARRAGR